MMGLGLLFMLVLFVLPIVLIAVLVGTLRVSGNK